MDTQTVIASFIALGIIIAIEVYLIIFGRVDRSKPKRS